MKCPSCPSELSRVDSETVQLDVCLKGCGGVWFDDKELERVDEMHEVVGLEVLQAGRNQNQVIVDRSKSRFCPKCAGVVMQNITFDPTRDLQLDSCPICKGIWLDCSELENMRLKNFEAADRAAVIKNFKNKAAASSPNMAKRLEAVFRLVF